MRADKLRFHKNIIKSPMLTSSHQDKNPINPIKHNKMIWKQRDPADRNHTYVTSLSTHFLFLQISISFWFSLWSYPPPPPPQNTLLSSPVSCLPSYPSQATLKKMLFCNHSKYLSLPSVLSPKQAKNIFSSRQQNTLICWIFPPHMSLPHCILQTTNVIL